MTTLMPDVFILCQSLSTGQRHTALMMAQELRPEMKTLVMMDAGIVYDLGQYNGEALNALDGPQALLTMLNMMLSQAEA